MDAQYTGNQIAQHRKTLNLTQRQLAERLHVTDKAVSKWERGINFPDLGLLEPLAEVLHTSPAVLLGLEQAGQAETLSTLAEISQQQLEEARKDLAFFSWGSAAVALLLALVYWLIPRQTPEKYYLLTVLIGLIGGTGLVYLFKYEQVKKWNVPELGTFFGAVFAQLVYQGYMFATGYSVPLWLGIVTMILTGFFVQFHFRQVMKPKLMQYLPLLLSLTAVIRYALSGNLGYVFPCILGGSLLASACHLFRIQPPPQ